MPKKIKILLSAYACEPNRGSEPGVGWNWAVEIAKRGHDVVVLTRKNNREVIEQETGIPTNLTFIYYDLPSTLMWLKKVFGVQLYYFLWQIGTYYFIKKQLKQLQLNFIHHITFVAIRKYSFLSLLNVPFYYGPLGGGENCPSYLLKNESNKNKIKEFIRNSLNKVLRFNFLSNVMFSKARKIFATTEQSAHYINDKFNNKINVFPAIGIALNKPNKIVNSQSDSVLQLLYVGHFIYLKGLQICLDALKVVNDKGVNFKLTLVGKGSEELVLKQKVKDLNLEANIEWINWIPQDELSIIYKRNDLFLFPSLHDSGGMVVLEAMSLGLPIVCFDIGGPGYFVNEQVGSKITVLSKTYDTVVADYANAIIKLSNSRELLQKKSTYASQFVSEYSWRNTIDKVYSIIEDDFNSIGEK
jgi:glycosyltransferase involved in cell wall biosynthesis